MRAHEFLKEAGGEAEIQNHLATMLTTLHATGIPSVTIAQVRQSLEDAGYFVNRQWIKSHSEKLGIVKSADDKSITLDVETSEPEPREIDADTDENKVKQMAKSALGRRKS
jgi:hypothetical protein